jgi:hypothetical protein
MHNDPQALTQNGGIPDFWFPEDAFLSLAKAMFLLVSVSVVTR